MLPNIWCLGKESTSLANSICISIYFIYYMNTAFQGVLGTYIKKTNNKTLALAIAPSASIAAFWENSPTQAAIWGIVRLQSARNGTFKSILQLFLRHKLHTAHFEWTQLKTITIKDTRKCLVYFLMWCNS